MAKKHKHQHDADWAEAKRLCRLSAEDVRMARELGFTPRGLISSRPSPQQRWKAPVHIWVRELYRKRLEKKAVRAARKAAASPMASTDAANHARSEPRPSPVPPEERREDGSNVGREEAFEGSEPGDEYWPGDEPERSWEEEIDDENRMMQRRQEEFRTAADWVAAALARLPMVERIVLFGSISQPLEQEVPRFRKFRRRGVALWHECKDVDLAVWVNDLSSLNTLRKEQSGVLNDLFDVAGVGVAHHQVDIFLMEPGTDRYLGRLCHFGTCPKGKPECRVPGCGASPFLRQHERFAFDPSCLDPAKAVVLFDRQRRLGPPSLDRWLDELPF
jgi:hypothetical protein